MGALEQLIQNEIDKRLAKSTLISSVPCKVVASLDNEVCTVELVTSKSRFNLVNYSGSPLSVGENVQVYYRGDTLTSQSGYIGASLTKGGDGGKDIYILGTKTLGSLTEAEKTFCNVAVKALKETTITLGFNANILGLTSGDYVFKFYVDSTQYDYVVKGNDTAGKYENCHVILPISLDVGEHIIEINGSGSGTVEDVKAFVSGQDITEGNVTIRQKSGYTPLDFDSLSTSLIDWSISGTAAGVGKLGKNYLKPKFDPIPNGAAGSWLSNTAWLADTLDQGYTFNTGEATIICFEFKHEGDANLLPAHIGNLMLVEGSTMPTQYDEETNVFKGTITNGCLAMSTSPEQSTFTVGVTQDLYAGEGEDGATHLYYVQSSKIPIRCKTFAIPVKKNTQYCVKSFNSAYSDIKIAISFLTAPGTITPTVTSCSPLPQKSIPGNETFNENTEQWINLVSSHWRDTSHFQVAVDARPLLYKYCESFATLKAGTYKVMCDVWGNNRFSGSGGWWVGISQYRGNVNDNYYDTGAPTNEWFVLLAEDDTQIIQKTEIIPTGTTRTQPISYGAPYPNYWHKEVTFTLAADTKVGLMHSAYYSSPSNPENGYFRFYIVDSTVDSVEFTTTGADPVDMTGYSAWEKYQVTLPVTITCGDNSQTITFDLDDLLYADDSISMATTSTALPSYVGLNTIAVDSINQPYIYIKYTGL